MAELEQRFLEASNQARAMAFKITTPTALTRAVNQFVAELKRFAVNGPEHSIITQTYYNELLRLKHGLLSLKQRALHDRIFNVINVTNATPRGITVMFEELIKGITYFASQRDPSSTFPVYHRYAACGVGTQIHRRDHLTCHKDITQRERNERKQKIETCYIERLIYDKLWQHESLLFPRTGTEVAPVQDDGHIHFLDVVRQDYRSCFKDCDIRVELEYRDAYPIRVSIMRFRKNTLTMTEIYERSYHFSPFGNKQYDALIECRKIILNKETEYRKIQDFMYERPWKRSKDQQLCSRCGR